MTPVSRPSFQQPAVNKSPFCRFHATTMLPTCLARNAFWGSMECFPLQKLDPRSRFRNEPYLFLLLSLGWKEHCVCTSLDSDQCVWVLRTQIDVAYPVRSICTLPPFQESWPLCGVCSTGHVTVHEAAIIILINFGAQLTRPASTSAIHFPRQLRRQSPGSVENASSISPDHWPFRTIGSGSAAFCFVNLHHL